MKRTLITALLWILFSFLANGLRTLAEWYATSPHGNAAGLSLSVLLVFPALLALLVLPVATLILALGRLRSLPAWKVVGASFVYLVAFGLCLRAGAHIRMEAMAELTQRSRPLVEALSEYERENGHPPREIAELVPSYLSTIPRTGLGAYPAYLLLTGEAAAIYASNTWVLKVDTPAGVLNFNMLAYFPNQNYPEVGHGGSWQRVHDWAYLHE